MIFISPSIVDMDSCYSINVQQRLILLFLLLTTINLTYVSAVREECIYKGDICLIDYQKCLVRKPDFKSYMKECSSSNILYGPGRIFNTRSEIPFNIIFDQNRDKYATPLTYRILQSGNDDEFTSIDDCCSVSENETCILPPLKNHDTDRQIVFVPLSNGTDKYCWYPIHERIGRLKWCDEKTDTVPCKSFTNGILKIQNTFDPLTTERFVDYCFFEAPGKYVTANRTNTTEKYTREVINITYGEKDGEIIIDNRTHSCELTKSVQKHFERHRRSASRAACVFTRSSLDNKWDSKPTCTIPPLKEPETTTIWVIIVIVLVIVAVSIFIASLSLWIYKKHIKTCFPDYEKTIKELSKTDVIDDDEGQNFIQNKNIMSLNKKSEVPDLIVSIDFAENQIEQSANELKEHAIIDETVKNQEDEKHNLDNANLGLSDFQVSECNRDLKECNQDDTMEYVKKHDVEVLENFCDGANDLTGKKSDLDSGFLQNASECFSPRSIDVTATEHQPVLMKKAVQNESNTPNNNDSSIDFAPITKEVERPCSRNKSGLDSGFSRSRSVSSSGSSTSSGNVTTTCHQPIEQDKVTGNGCDGYTQKDDVIAMDYLFKTRQVKKSRVSESSSGRGSMD